jgi:hypothetical protein
MVSFLRGMNRSFDPNRNEESGDWRELFNTEVRNLYRSLNIVRMMIFVDWACSADGWNKKYIQNVVDKNLLKSGHLEDNGDEMVTRRPIKYIQNVTELLGAAVAQSV